MQKLTEDKRKIFFDMIIDREKFPIELAINLGYLAQNIIKRSNKKPYWLQSNLLNLSLTEKRLLNENLKSDFVLPDMIYGEKLLSTISELFDKREKDVIELYFGLNRDYSYKPLSLTKVGKQYSLSGQRIGSIKTDSLKKLFTLNSLCMYFIPLQKYGEIQKNKQRCFEYFSMEEHAFFENLKEISEGFQEIIRARWGLDDGFYCYDFFMLDNKLGIENSKQLYKKAETEFKKFKPTIADLNLSVRAYNVLWRMYLCNISLEKIKNLTEKELMKQRNCGKETAKEIITKLNEFYNR